MTAVGGHPLGPFSAYASWPAELVVAGVVLAVSLILFRSSGAGRVDALAERLVSISSGPGRRRLGGIAALLTALIVCLVVAAAVLDRFPNSADEYGDLFLAETLSQGRVSNDLPEHAEFFRVIHVAQKDGKWVARYPPGWPAVIALLGLLEVPAWVVNPLFGALTLLLVYRFAERFIGAGAGPIAATLMGVSAFFVFTSASYRSHVISAFWILAGAYFLALCARERRPGHAIVSGLAFGAAFATRPYTALLCAAPLLAYLVRRQGRGAARSLAYLSLGALPGVAALLTYNYLVTGDPFLLTTVWMDPDEGLGFRDGHTAVNGTSHALRRLGALIEWTNPALLPVFALCLAGQFRRQAGGMFAWIGLTLPALVIGHFFYHAFGGTQYGPRFYYEAYPFVCLVVVHSLVRRPAAEGSDGVPVMGPRGLLWSRRALLAGSLFALITLPVAGFRLHGVVRERQDVFDLVRRQEIHHAIVFVASPTGRTWPMPVQDLVRNGTRLDGDVLYAYDLGSHNRVLQEAHPGRAYYRYVREPASPTGRLEPLEVDRARPG